MIRVAICEDNPQDAQNLIALLEGYPAYGPQLILKAFAETQQLLFEYEEGGSPFDVLLMDIEMPGMDGMEAAGRIRAKDPDVVILFITIHDNPRFLREGYSLHAFDYIVKPIDPQRLYRSLDTALERLRHGRERRVVFSTRWGIISLPVREILWLEKEGSGVILHTGKRRYRVSITLKEAVERYGPGLLQLSRYAYVSPHHILEVQLPGREALLSDGSRVLVSKYRLKGVLQALKNLEVPPNEP